MNELERAKACAGQMYGADAASQALGITVDVLEPGRVTATMRVRDDMINGFDVCHGGLLFTLADTAFAFACNAYDDLSVAASANMEFLQAAHVGDVLTATASEEHRGRRGGLYTVEVVNQDDVRIALFRGRSAALGRALLDDESDTEELEKLKNP